MTLAIDEGGQYGPLHQHAVQFYEDEAFLVARVAEYLAAGIRAGEPCIVIATPEHNAAFDARLRLLDVSTDAITFADAKATLGQFMDGGMPDAQRFRRVLGGEIEKAGGAFGRVRAYGEMVDLLWRDGKPDAAIRLEELWNDLADEHAFSLLCAYPMGNFHKESDRSRFERVCETHHVVRPTERFNRIGDNDRDRRIALLEQRAAVLEMEIANRKRLEQQNAFLLDATAALTRSVGYESRLRALADVVVPRLADCCVVDIAREDTYDRLAISCADAALAHSPTLHERWRTGRTRDPVLTVLRTGKPLIVSNLTDEHLSRFARDEEHANELRALGLRSCMIVPMILAERVVGALTLVAAESGRRYAEDDLPLAMDLASRAAGAVEAARLHHVAEENNRAKDDFLATLSHELRTPLTSILGWAHILSKGDLDDETLRTAVGTIEHSARIQASLIDDLLDVSRVVSGKLSLQSDPVDLAEVIGSAFETMRVAADAKRIRVELSGLDGRTIVKGDSTRLQQVVWNLVSNAIKFSAVGAAVQLRLEHDESHARIVVHDEGRGISPSFLPFVFEPFRQADASATRHHGGLGLGLAIVKYLVEGHGGRVRAESPGLGAGATFTVTLPLAR